MTPMATWAASGEEVAMIAISGGIIVAIAAIVSGSVKTVLRTRHQEESRREIAAYVAEGSITPADAVKILNAGAESELKKQLASGVAWGTVSARQAERLLQAERAAQAEPERT